MVDWRTYNRIPSFILKLSSCISSHMGAHVSHPRYLIYLHLLGHCCSITFFIWECTTGKPGPMCCLVMLRLYLTVNPEMGGVYTQTALNSLNSYVLPVVLICRFLVISFSLQPIRLHKPYAKTYTKIRAPSTRPTRYPGLLSKPRISKLPILFLSLTRISCLERPKYHNNPPPPGNYPLRRRDARIEDASVQNQTYDGL
jgi:hypothetical protein